jgi:hypothetical protein
MPDQEAKQCLHCNYPGNTVEPGDDKCRHCFRTADGSVAPEYSWGYHDRKQQEYDRSVISAYRQKLSEREKMELAERLMCQKSP